MKRLSGRSNSYASLLVSMLAALVIISVPPAVSAQENPGQNEQYRYPVTFVETPPTVDGDPSDRAWKQAEVMGQFTQLEPDSGAPSTERTEVRVLFDDDTIYFGEGVPRQSTVVPPASYYKAEWATAYATLDIDEANRLLAFLQASVWVT